MDKQKYERKSLEYISENFKEVYIDSFTNSFENYWEDIMERYYWHEKYSHVLEKDNYPLGKWFSGGKISPSYNLLDLKVEKYGTKDLFKVYDFRLGKIVRTISLNEVFDRVKKLSFYLRSKGIKKGDVVGIYCPSSPESFIFAHACFRIGAVIFGISETFSEDEIKKRVDRLKMKAVLAVSGRIVGNQIVPMLSKLAFLEKENDMMTFLYQCDFYEETNLGTCWEVINQDLENFTTFEDYYEVLDSHDPLVILQTSGSTGEPKFVFYTACSAMCGSMNINLNNCIGEDEINAMYTIVTSISICWVTGMFLSFGITINCPTIILTVGEPFLPNINTFFEMLVNVGVNACFIASGNIRMLKSKDPHGKLIQNYNLSKLTSLVTAGDLLDTSTEKWFFETFPENVRLSNVFGQTESNSGTTNRYCNKNQHKYGSSNRPHLGVCMITHEDKLLFKAPTTPMFCGGFWGEDESKSKFVEKYFLKIEDEYYFNTGDYAKIDEDFYVFILGRDGDVLKIGQNRLKIGANEIESLINSNKLIVESVATEILVDDVFKLIIFLKLISGTDEEDVSSIVKSQIETTYDEKGIVERVVILSDIPKNINGKILRPLIKKIVAKEEYSVPATILNVDVVTELVNKLNK